MTCIRMLGKLNPLNPSWTNSSNLIPSSDSKRKRFELNPGESGAMGNATNNASSGGGAPNSNSLKANAKDATKSSSSASGTASSATPTSVSASSTSSSAPMLLISAASIMSTGVMTSGTNTATASAISMPLLADGGSLNSMGNSSEILALDGKGKCLFRISFMDVGREVLLKGYLG